MNAVEVAGRAPGLGGRRDPTARGDRPSTALSARPGSHVGGGPYGDRAFGSSCCRSAGLYLRRILRVLRARVRLSFVSGRKGSPSGSPVFVGAVYILLRSVFHSRAVHSLLWPRFYQPCRCRDRGRTALCRPPAAALTARSSSGLASRGDLAARQPAGRIAPIYPRRRRSLSTRTRRRSAEYWALLSWARARWSSSRRRRGARRRPTRRRTCARICPVPSTRFGGAELRRAPIDALRSPPTTGGCARDDYFAAAIHGARPSPRCRAKDAPGGDRRIRRPCFQRSRPSAGAPGSRSGQVHDRRLPGRARAIRKRPTLRNPRRRRLAAASAGRARVGREKRVEALLHGARAGVCRRGVALALLD